MTFLLPYPPALPRSTAAQRRAPPDVQDNPEDSQDRCRRDRQLALTSPKSP